MCGIVGLFFKNDDLHGALGRMFSPMLAEMTDRGPDSAGVAVYRNTVEAGIKATLFSPDPHQDWDALCDRLRAELRARVEREPVDSHQLLFTDAGPDEAIDLIETEFPEIQVMSIGNSIEIYKETGLPRDVIERFGIERMAGSHAVGHTRMATESAVTTEGSHPFSTGPDLCLVHNGSLSNHNWLRDSLKRQAGAKFRTENDTEVAAAYITHRLREGRSLHGALEDCVAGLDGFYTLVAGTADGFAVLRDPIACKPAVLAETPDYVAFGSEFRALAALPEIRNARVWEPEPAHVYSWGLN